MPKPHVHLIPPPLNLALDARMTGNEARFVRSGCRPNAVLRPVLCRKSRDRKKEKEKGKKQSASGAKDGRAAEDGRHSHGHGQKTKKHGVGRAKDRLGTFGAGDNGMDVDVDADVDIESGTPDGIINNDDDSENTEDDNSPSGSRPPSPTVEFAIFALRDLKAQEEVVLGWEWDDGAVVHELPALVRMLAGGAHEGKSSAEEKLSCVELYLISSFSITYTTRPTNIL